MRYIIYKITNEINGKIYIGKHRCKRLDDTYFGSGFALKHAIKKYGKENFIFHLEFELHNEEEMDLLEKYVVNEEFLKRNDVYNLKTGGEGGGFYSLKSRKKMSNSHKGHIPWNRGKKTGHIPWNKGKTGIIPWNNGKHSVYSEETLKKMSENRKGKCCGKDHPFYGRHHSKESRKKMSLSHIGKPSNNKGKKLTEKQKQKIRDSKDKVSMKVLQYNLDNIFVCEYASLREAERKTGIGHSNIKKCCNGVYNQMKGYKFFWKSDLVYFF